jgi:protein tyrosine phosphatase (PTP) superfamily phosphohydrolase (DUF442 family)
LQVLCGGTHAACLCEANQADTKQADSKEADKDGTAGLVLSSLISEEQAGLISTVFREMRRREASVSAHKHCSFIVEALLRCSPAHFLVQYWRAVTPYVGFCGTNRFSSHVLETAFAVTHDFLSGARVIEEASDVDDDAEDQGEDGGKQKEETDEAGGVLLPAVSLGDLGSAKSVRNALCDALQEVAAALLAKAGPLIFDTSGTYLLRALASTLAGIRPESRGRPSLADLVGSDGPSSHAEAKWTKHSRGGGGAKKAATAGDKVTSDIRNAVRGSQTLVEAFLHQQLQQHVASASVPLLSVCREQRSRFLHTCGKDRSRQLLNSLLSLVKTLAEADTGDHSVSADVDPASASGAHLKGFYVYSMSCHVSAGPSLQHMLAVCALAAPDTARYLMRKLLNIGSEGLPASAYTLLESGSAADAREERKREKEASKKRRRDDSASAPAAVAEDTGDMSHTWIDQLVHDPVGSHLVEAIVAVAAAAAPAAAAAAGASTSAAGHVDLPFLRLLFVHYFSGRLSALASHSHANFVAQRLLAQLPALAACAAADQDGEDGAEAEDAAGRSLAVRAVREVLPVVGHILGAEPRATQGAVAAGAEATGPVVSYSSNGNRDGVVWNLVSACNGTVADPAGASTAAAGAITATLQKQIVETLAMVAYGLDPTSAIARASVSTVFKPGDPHFARWWLNINGYRDKVSTLGLRAAAAACNKEADAPTAPAGGYGYGSGSANPGSTIAQVTVSAAGVRILASLALHYQAAIAKPVLDSILALSQREMAGVSTEPTASRYLVEALLDAPSDLQWAKHKLFSALKGKFAALACTRFGCWVTSKAFHQCDLRRKTAIAGELSAHERALGGTPGGRQLVRLLRLEHFKQSQEGWAAGWSKAASKATMFSDIIGDGAAGTTTASAAASSAPAAGGKSSFDSKNNRTGRADDVGRGGPSGGFGRDRTDDPERNKGAQWNLRDVLVASAPAAKRPRMEDSVGAAAGSKAKDASKPQPAKKDVADDDSGSDSEDGAQKAAVGVKKKRARRSKKKAPSAQPHQPQD